jgi:hypothetical protein
LPNHTTIKVGYCSSQENYDMHIDEVFIVDTVKGKCECVDINGVYQPLHEINRDFIGEYIMDIERKQKVDKEWKEWEQMEFEWREKE